MKNNKTIFLILLSFASVLFSCNKWLDVNPKTQLEKKAMFSDELGFKDALVGCYIKLKDKGLYGVNLSGTTIEYLSQSWIPKETGVTKELTNFNYENSDVKDQFKSIYSNLYNIIVQANDILLNIDAKKSVFNSFETFNVIKGEALAIRAFCHLDLLRMFGQLPKDGTKQIYLRYLEDVSINGSPFVSNSEYISKLERDLKDAEALLLKSDPVLRYSITALNSPIWLSPLLEDDFLAYRRFRLNYYAVKAIQARFYLYTNNPEDAKEAAMAVIEAKNSNGQQFFFNSPQAFALTAYALPHETISCLNVFNIKDHLESYFTDEKKLLYQNKDLIGTLFQGETTNNRATKIWGEISFVGSTYYTIRKYSTASLSNEDEGSTMIFDKQFIPLIRLSEMYLIVIEASDYTQAQPFFDLYRADRGMSPKILTSNEEKMEEVLKEYRREFYAEGQMFYTYKRLFVKNMMWRTQPVVEENYIIPFPDSEFGYSNN